jgi:hypothetical protein
VNHKPPAYPITAVLFILTAIVTAATLSVDWSWPVWSAGAQWVWSGYQTALISTSEIGLAVIALVGWLTWRGSAKSLRGRGPGRRITIVSGLGLLLFVGLSGLGAAAPYLSLARLADVTIGFLACLAISREPSLRAWLVVAGLAVVAIQLPIVLAQQISQSTFPLQSLALSGAAEIPASAPGAFVLQLPGGLRWQRSMGSFPHPNVLGGFAATMIVLALPRLRGDTGLRWAAIFVWLLAWIELGLSFSRAGAVAASVGCAIWGVAQIRKVGRMPTAIPIGVAIAGLIVATLGSRVFAGDSSLPASGPAVSERLLLASVAGDMIRQHPLFGVGAGNFPLVESLPPYDGIMVDPVHIVPLLVAAEAGIIAGVAWLVLVVGSPIAELRSRVRLPTNAYHHLAVAATLLILSSLDHYFWTLPPGRALFWIAVGAGVIQ